MGWADLDNWVEPSSRKGWVGLISTQNGRIDLSPTNLSYFFFWVGLDQNMSGLGLHGCWPDSATMLINLPFHAEREVLHAATNFAVGGVGEKGEGEESNLARWSSL